MSQNDLVADVEAYLNANRAAVERVAAAFEEAGGEAEDLDDLVLDVAGSYGADAANDEATGDAQDAAIVSFESQGSEVNDGGPTDQVAAILMGNGAEEGERLVMAATGSSPRP